MARARSGRQQADLNLFFRIHTKPGTDTLALLDALDDLDIVDVAAPAAKPAPSSRHRELRVAPGLPIAASAGGIDADYAQTLAGGKGRTWPSWTSSTAGTGRTRTSARLSAAGSSLANGAACDPFAASAGATDHGTAVLGELAGDPNAFGVTGSPRARRSGPSTRVAGTGRAVRRQHRQRDQHRRRQHLAGRRHPDRAAVIRPEPPTRSPTSAMCRSSGASGAVWAAIRNATSRGRIVIEAAATATRTSTAPLTWTRSARTGSSYDSGAILVGAGNAPGCAWGSVRPSRAAGCRSPTTAAASTCRAGATASPPPATVTCRAAAGGSPPTRGRSPVRPARRRSSPRALALLSSVAESRGTTPPSARSARRSRRPGRPRQPRPHRQHRPAAEHQGRDRLARPEARRVRARRQRRRLGTATVPVRQSWTASGSAAVQYEVWLSKDGARTSSRPSRRRARRRDLPARADHDYQFVARAVDASGTWGDWSYGKKFTLGQYEENYTTTNPAFTGAWTRAAWQPASGGYVKVSATAGNRSTFSSTGSNVAWIGTKATTVARRGSTSTAHWPAPSTSTRRPPRRSPSPSPVMAASRRAHDRRARSSAPPAGRRSTWTRSSG